MRLNRPSRRMDSFAAWQVFNAPSERSRQAIDAFCKRNPKDVFFSIVLLISGHTRAGIEETIVSIAAQSYPNFELIIVEDARGRPDLKQALEEWKQHDSRIRLLRDERASGKSAANNLAVDVAKGDFIVLVDQDGRMQENALLLLADYIRRNPAVDIVYGDDAEIDSEAGGLNNPRFKPDWSPELLLSSCYTSPLQALRASLYSAVGGCRPNFEGAHGHDLLLRASEKARQVGHVPQLLFHRRAPSSPAEAGGEPSLSGREAGCRAVADAFNRRGIACRVESPQWARERGVEIYVPEMPQDGPSVAIVILTKNNWKILDRLIQSLRGTTYKNYKVYIVDNMSDDQATIAYLKSVQHDVIPIANPGEQFNYAYVNNRAVEQVDADFVLFLNDDTSVISPNWLSQMMGWARLTGVGAVGARLLFPDGRVQHGGVVLGLRKGLTAFRGLPGNDPGYLSFAKATRNCTAVTAAAMLTPRSLFLELGGFDEIAFAVSYNDVDYCLRLGDAGYRIVYCGEAELYHHQGYTRGSGSTSPLERAELTRRHGGRVDPYYSPHLSLDGQQFAIKPTVVPPLPLGRPIQVLFCTEELNEAAETVFDLTSDLKREGTIAARVASLKDGEMHPAYERDGIAVTELRSSRALQNLRTLRDYEQWLADIAAEAGCNSFDVIHAEGAASFWAIDAARRCGVPSIWAIRDNESPKIFRDLSRQVAGVAIRCFQYPYRVIFDSETARKRWAHFDRLNNFDLTCEGPDLSGGGRERMISAYRKFIAGAAFSAVPRE